MDTDGQFHRAIPPEDIRLGPVVSAAALLTRLPDPARRDLPRGSPERGRLEHVTDARVHVGPVALVRVDGVTQERRQVLVHNDVLRAAGHAPAASGIVEDGNRSVEAARDAGLPRSALLSASRVASPRLGSLRLGSALLGSVLGLVHSDRQTAV